MSAAAAGRDEIRTEMLRRFYRSYFVERDYLRVRAVLQENDWNETSFRKALERMTRDGLIKLKDSAPSYEIKLAGIFAAEEEGVAPPDLLVANRRARTLILEAYANAEESQDYEYGVDGQTLLAGIARTNGADSTLLESNHDFLFDAGRLESPGSNGYFRLTSSAEEAVDEWRRQTSLLRGFEALAGVANPQERGRAFQRLMGDLARDAGWSASESVLAAGEEIDLVLNRADSFYLVECRWWKDPVGAKEIRDFTGKLRKRLGIAGLFVSMSGFSSDAVVEVETITGDAAVLLYGPQDVAALFERSVPFDEMISTKKRALVMQRRATWA